MQAAEQRAVERLTSGRSAIVEISSASKCSNCPANMCPGCPMHGIGAETTQRVTPLLINAVPELAPF